MSIDRTKYILDCLAEECAEVAIRASKAIRFGLAEKQLGQDQDNRERLCAELQDLFGVIGMLNGECALGFEPDSAAMKAKRAKIERFLVYSVELGEVA